MLISKSMPAAVIHSAAVGAGLVSSPVNVASSAVTAATAEKSQATEKPAATQALSDSKQQTVTNKAPKRAAPLPVIAVSPPSASTPTFVYVIHLIGWSLFLVLVLVLLL